MSTKKGSGLKRTGPQRHQNTHVWKYDMNKTDPKTKLIQNVVVSNCCEKCTGVIEWKRKYGKYKPLSAPAKCKRCSEKRVKYAYHQFCTPCVKEHGGCAKCGQTEIEVVNKPAPTAAESAKMEAEFQKEMKLLPERKRRTFLRYLQQEEKKLRSTKTKLVTEEVDGQEVVVEEEPEPNGPKTLHDVHLIAFEKLKDLREKYGKLEGGDLDDLDDFDDDDLADLDLSDEDIGDDDDDDDDE